MDAIEAVTRAILAANIQIDCGVGSDNPGKVPLNIYEAEEIAQAALSAARPFIAAEWQPIETAPPPHNEVVLLYWQDWSGAEYMEAARYSTGERLSNGYSNYSQHSWATDWQPLPAPPTAIKETIR